MLTRGQSAYQRCPLPHYAHFSNVAECETFRNESSPEIYRHVWRVPPGLAVHYVECVVVQAAHGLLLVREQAVPMPFDAQVPVHVEHL